MLICRHFSPIPLLGLPRGLVGFAGIVVAMVVAFLLCFLLESAVAVEVIGQDP